MTEELNLNDPNPTNDIVMRWGYDEQMVLLECDEDLILHDIRYVPVLIELASDSACPKQAYVIGILYSYTQFVLRYRHYRLAKAMAPFADRVSTASEKLLQVWKDYFLHIYHYLIEPRSLSAEEAEALAFDLIVGPHRLLRFERTGKEIRGWTEFRAFGISFEERLFIDPHTGIWLRPNEKPS